MGTYPGLEAPDFAKPTSRLAFWRHIPQDEGRHSVATEAWALLCTPFGRKVASLLASDGGIDDRWGLGRAAVPRSRCRPSTDLISLRRRSGRPPAPGGSASHGLDCFRAESCSPLGERMAVPHHFIPLLLGCLSASLKMVRDVTNEQRPRQPLSKPTLWAVASWLIFCPVAAGSALCSHFSLGVRNASSRSLTRSSSFFC
jgi:hypothetical protein